MFLCPVRYTDHLSPLRITMAPGETHRKEPLLANQERDPRAYELMTVFVPDLSDEDTQTQVDKVATFISNAGGSVTETLTSSPWGRRRLAYTIRFNGVDYRDGVYTVYHFDSAPSNLTELERDLKLDTSTMRYLLVHDDPKAGEKFPQGEEAAEGETEAASAAGEAASASAEAATTEATETEAAEPQASAETTDAEATAETTEAEVASAESSEERATESATSSETESSDDTTETNEDESSDKE
jgi:small subunit ribosomal protein S6